MEYSASPQTIVHVGTGKRMHEDNQPLPSVVTDSDMNQIIWSLMEIVLAGGQTPQAFDPGVPATYQVVRNALAELGRRCYGAIAAAGGAADAITATLSPSPVALVDGMTVRVRAAAANATTAPTFALAGLAAKGIVKGNSRPLAAGDIAGAGHWLELQFDALLDKWLLSNPAFGVTTDISGFTGSNHSLASIGWQKLPGGLILQWGMATAAASSTSGVSFPLAFPVAVFGVLVSVIPGGVTVTTAGGAVNGSITLTGFQYSNTNTDGAAASFWLAIGK